MTYIMTKLHRDTLTDEFDGRFFFRRTNHCANEIHVFTAAQSPRLMDEVGRLREEAFGAAGGGTGRNRDIDDDDVAENGYSQLVVWSPALCEIVGGYRFIISSSSHPQHLSTEHYFEFSDRFRHHYLPFLMELGRAFVNPLFRHRSSGPNAVYALDNLWDGLASLVMCNPSVRYLFGKVTTYPDYNPEARRILDGFLQTYFPDRDRLLRPRSSLSVVPRGRCDMFGGDDYRADYGLLRRELAVRGECVPSMMSAYMNLSSTMRVFDTVVNSDFGNVFETGILLTVADIHPDKLERHTRGFTPDPHQS